MCRSREETDAISRVAFQALERCHYDAQGEDQKTECVAACYECLMSFNNQLEALFLDRRSIHDSLLDLTRCRTLPRIGNRTYSEHYDWIRSLTDERSDLERRFLDALAGGNYRLPDDAQRSIAGTNCVADFYYSPNVAVFCDGSVHDQTDQRHRDAVIRQNLVAHGYRVIVIRYDQDLADQISCHHSVFGRG